MSDKSDPLSQPDFKARAGMSGVGRGFKDTVATDAPPAFYVDQAKVEAMGLFDSGATCPVTFGDAPVVASSGGGDSVMCQVLSSSNGGYRVKVYPNGSGNEKGTYTATLLVPDIALDATIESGSWIIGHLMQMKVTGGGRQSGG